MNNCTICGRPIVLQPTAAERAAKDVTGKTAAYYTGLFTEHSTCTIAKRSQESIDLMRSKQDESMRVYGFVHQPGE